MAANRKDSRVVSDLLLLLTLLVVVLLLLLVVLLLLLVVLLYTDPPNTRMTLLMGFSRSWLELRDPILLLLLLVAADAGSYQ
jgi:hypothetical protein